jgi:hypothetical protein
MAPASHWRFLGHALVGRDPVREAPAGTSTARASETTQTLHRLGPHSGGVRREIDVQAHKQTIHWPHGAPLANARAVLLIWSSRADATLYRASRRSWNRRRALSYPPAGAFGEKTVSLE